MRQITITENDSGVRLTRFLMKYLSAPSSLVYSSLRKKKIRLNGKHPKEDAVLQTGDVLSLYLSDDVFPASTFQPGKDDIQVVYEDAHILIVNKPAMLPCQPDEKHPTDTLIDKIKSYLYNKKEYRPDEEHTFAPALSNRIDTNTCGLVIAAKDAESLRTMNEKIRNREVHKEYLALVCGVPKEKEATLTGTIQKDKASNKSHMAEDGKEVSLTYRAADTIGEDALLSVTLRTGRSHQIRTQLADIGHPLLGDPKYGGRQNPAYPYQALCAYRLTFDFPTDAGVLNYLNGKTVTLPEIPFLSKEAYEKIKKEL